MTLADELQRARELSTWLEASVNGIEVSSSDRARMAGGCLDQVHENHKAIRVLLQHQLAGAAGCMVRPTLETHVRGLWLKNCATDAEVAGFIADKRLNPIGKLLEEIEKGDGYNVGVPSKVKGAPWAAMCSYAHGGYHQAVRRNTVEHIAPNYSAEEQAEVMRFASAIAVLAAFEIFVLAKRDNLASQCAQRLQVP